VVASFSTQDKGAFAGDDYQGNIGAGILKRFVVTFDYEHQIVYLKALPEPVADVGTYDRAGMWFNRAPDGFEVVDVTKNSPAEAAGIKAGDHIVAVDGKPAAETPVYELRRRLRNAAPGTVTRFTLVQAGQTREVAVTLRDLI
jgi:S1-C subfamily serine protease